MLTFFISLFISLSSSAEGVQEKIQFTTGSETSPVSVNWSFPDTFSLRVFNALENLRQLPPLQSAKIKSHFISTPPLSFIVERVGKIHLNTEPRTSECVPGVVAYVRDPTSKTLYVCPYAESLSLLALQSNLLHESRHLDGEAGYPHVLCVRGDFEDYEACDENLEAGGAYGIQTEFFLKIAATEAIESSIRQEARGLAAIYLLDHFNQAPFELVEGALLLSEDGSLEFFDGKNQPHKVMSGISSASIVTLRTFPTVLNSSERSVKSYVTAATFMDTPGAFSKQFRQLSPSQKSRILDVYYGGMQACFLFTDAIYCEVGDRSVNLPLPKELRPLHFNVFTMFGGDMVFIVSRKGEYYSVPLKKEVEEWGSAPLEKNETLAGFRSVAMMPGVFNSALTLDGQLVVFDKIVEPQVVEATRDRRFKKILAPFLWSPRFEDI